MKAISIHDLTTRGPAIATWLREGHVILLTQDEELLGRIFPATITMASPALRRELFAHRLAPRPSLPARDLSNIVTENRGPL